MSLYHFTCIANLQSILDRGYLRPTESNVSGTRPLLGPNVVWLVDTPVLDADHGLGRSGLIEHAARRGVVFADDYLASVDKTRVRIEVDPTGCVRWVDWPWQSRMTKKWRDALVAPAGGMDAATHWWVHEGRVTRDAWRGVEVDGVPLDLSEVDPPM
ncbi:MAG: hypothetical protein M9886_03945 [Candidatus Nanopelagicales bacterium]|nr:hypothetical protein [Candidatus Nanopelagicales bacterium]